MRELLRDSRLHVGALVCLCFVLGPVGYFAWFYNLAELADATSVDFYTLVIAYFVQALGVVAYMVARQKLGPRRITGTVATSLVLFVTLTEPAARSGMATVALATGIAASLPCGYFQGHYLTCLVEISPSREGGHGRGIALGAGYAVATLLSYLLSTLASGSLVRGLSSLATCVVLALLIGVCLWIVAKKEPSSDPAPTGEAGMLRPVVLIIGAAVILASLVKNTGFRSLTEEFAGGSIELSRLFYGVGLVAAGLVADRDRRLSLICCAASLSEPFLQLALSGVGTSGFVLWSLGYLLQGFFTVWRVVVFADLAESSGRVWLAGAGLAFGRVGDALGTWLTLAMAGEPAWLIVVAFVLFAVGFFLLLRVYALQFGTGGTAAEVSREELDPIVSFCEKHAITRREQDVLTLMLDGLTNQQIASELSVTEGTVKFHMTNILKKTACRTRYDVAKLYNRELRGE